MIQNDTDRRKFARIAFHLPVTIIGHNEDAQIIDFSINGFFIKINAVEAFREGQQIRLAVKFPHDKASTIIKSEIVRVEPAGFGCEFKELSPSTSKLLEMNFDIFRSTLPIE